MQHLDGFSMQYAQTPLQTSLSMIPGAYNPMTSPFYLPRPLPGGFPQQLPTPLHPFTLAERLAGTVVSFVFNFDNREGGGGGVG